MSESPSTASRDQLLTLKVMRLTRPSFAASRAAFACEADEAAQTELCRAVAAVGTGQPPHLWTPLGSTLLLPQSFESIHLGETFTFYVCVHNDSAQTAADVSVKADLQTSSQRVNLPSSLEEAIDELTPDQSIGQVISHEVKEVGQHILVCAVTYTTPAGEKMYFRKFFKFPVSKPLDVKTKFYNAESDDVFLEAQIQNTTSVPMTLERVSLDPSELYSCTELKGSEPENRDISVEGPNYLNPQDVRQYLYCLSPKPGVPVKNYRGVTSIGKLDMVWRISMGERGRLQTSQLQRMAPGYGDLRLTIEQSPSTVALQEVFEITCQLHNCCDRPLSLLLALDSSLQPGLLWYSTSGVALGQLDANTTRSLTLALLPLVPGLQTISGIRLTDTFLKRTYEHDEIAQVFVQ